MKDQGHPDLLALAKQAWRGELDLQFEHHPVHRYYPGSCRIAEDLLGFKGIAGFYVIDSGDGLVMLDAGHLLDVKRCFEDVRRWRSDTPVTAAIYSHHHALAGTARYMRSIEEQSVAAMNRGSSLDQVVQSVKPPADLADEPYRANADSQPSSMARNILNHAALASDRGRRDLASDE